MKYKTYDDYWLAYLSAHRKPLTRIFHYFGTILALLIGFVAYVKIAWWAWLILGVVGYGILLVSHYLIEGNRPFGQKPIWGLYSDLRMLGLEMTGKLKVELNRLD